MAKSYCDNCVYSGSLTGLNTRCCNYLLATNQRRPCPPGPGCTVKVSREVKRRRKKCEKDGKQSN